MRVIIAIECRGDRPEPELSHILNEIVAGVARECLAAALLDAEVRIGQLLKELPKASGGKPFHKSYSLHVGENKESWF